MRDVKVKTFRSPRAMERGIGRMVGRGYAVADQSGEFSPNLWITPRWRRRKVAVTFRRSNDE